MVESNPKKTIEVRAKEEKRSHYDDYVMYEKKIALRLKSQIL